jgi:divalent metal cation (Fe/Co/Zn/Cd) transporter
VDLHLVVPKTATLEEAYGIVKHIETDVKREFPRTSVTIRVQPCTGEDCSACGVFTTCPVCDHRTKRLAEH